MFWQYKMANRHNRGHEQMERMLKKSFKIYTKAAMKQAKTIYK